MDWLRFWNQFETEIDKAAISQVAKFIRKELLISKIRSVVGLHYDMEGYERAKAISKAKYGRPSEVANAHIHTYIHTLLQLPKEGISVTKVLIN